MSTTKKFIYALSSNWYANQAAYEATYANSIVFIHGEDAKGLEIYTHGSYFKTDVNADLLNGLVEQGENIVVSVSDEGKLLISAPGTETITATSTDLVQAKAVAKALTSPIELSLSLNDGVASFSETFGTLDNSGATATATTAVLKAGKNITFSNDNGLVITGEDWSDEITEAKSGAISDAKDYTDAEIKKVSDALAGKNVTAEGDGTYITATAEGNKVTVTATQEIKDAVSYADSAL
jgi:hypothetical protein